MMLLLLLSINGCRPDSFLLDASDGFVWRYACMVASHSRLQIEVLQQTETRALPDELLRD